jgi:hypothetical protein
LVEDDPVEHAAHDRFAVLDHEGIGPEPRVELLAGRKLGDATTRMKAQSSRSPLFNAE